MLSVNHSNIDLFERYLDANSFLLNVFHEPFREHEDQIVEYHFELITSTSIVHCYSGNMFSNFKGNNHLFGLRTMFVRADKFSKTQTEDCIQLYTHVSSPLMLFNTKLDDPRSNRFSFWAEVKLWGIHWEQRLRTCKCLCRIV